MSTVYLLKYNNYYNRIVAREKNLEGYLLQEYLLDRKDDVNFVEDDGVDTTYVCNTETTPDYMVVANGNVIESRWFVIERKILRKGQYKFTLHRDLLVDYYNAIVNAQCFIEKATVLASDPFIFNQEDMTFNQIKTSETLLKDETGCAWVVGYIPKDAFPDGATVEGDAILDNTADITVEDLTKWEYYQYIAADFLGGFKDVEYIGHVENININDNGQTEKLTVIQFGANTAGITQGKDIYSYFPQFSKNYGLQISARGNQEYVKQQAPSKWKSLNLLNFANKLGDFLGKHSAVEIQNFWDLRGKIITDTATGLFYRIKINETILEDTVEVTNTNIPQLFTLMQQTTTETIQVPDGQLVMTGSANDNTYQAHYQIHAYRIELEQILQHVTATISKPGERYHLEDQPYDMFCIPYSDTLEIKKNTDVLVTANKSVAVNIAIQIAAATGANNVYDVQLLPYCPCRYAIKEDGTINVGSAKYDSIKKRDNTLVGIIFWCTSSAFTFDIPHIITASNEGLGLKIESQCDLYRLVSPNYNGQFEFSPAKNGGVTSFNVDCSYKPFSPYIHINPSFNRMYGRDFNDARGLICGGDFSLPQLSNAWANYQLSNKNYQNIFDRQIVNLEVNNKIQRTREITSAALGAVQGALTGGITGGMVGGVGGAVVGGILGAGASAAAGVADVKLADQLRAETIDYTRDMYGYNLGNIQAIPTSLAKTSAFTFNNKLFPVLEYYTCSAEEKTALTNKCKWNGMTVMRIDRITSFIANQQDQYIKARVIRIIDNSLDDYHMVKAIDDELNRGAFF